MQTYKVKMEDYLITNVKDYLRMSVEKFWERRVVRYVRYPQGVDRLDTPTPLLAITAFPLLCQIKYIVVQYIIVLQSTRACLLCGLPTRQHVQSSLPQETRETFFELNYCPIHQFHVDIFPRASTSPLGKILATILT